MRVNKERRPVYSYIYIVNGSVSNWQLVCCILRVLIDQDSKYFGVINGKNFSYSLITEKSDYEIKCEIVSVGSEK
jgi:hypothetical protein